LFAIREARLSIWKTLKNFFEDDSIWSPAFNVYGIGDMGKESTSLTRPFVFLLDSRILFETKHLPLVIIDAEFAIKAFELGTNPWGLCRGELHVFGRTRGERDDLVGAIIKHVTEITLYDFDTEPPTVTGTAELVPDSDGVYWRQVHNDISTEVAMEQSLANWDTLSFTFYVPDIMQ